MNDIVQIPLPLPHIRSVNAWLLRGDPLTLVDTGPRSDEALSALEAGLRDAGARLEDLELVLVTHHHLDHAGLAATIAERSGARIAALEAAATYGANYDERSAADRNFSRALMRHHGVPEETIAESEGFWDYIRENSEAYDTDVRLADGQTIRAGGRDLRVLHRPGHSTTDTLLVDDGERLAFVGDHLLGRVSSNTEIYPAAEPTGTRPRARVEYLANLRRTARLPLERLLTGHGDPVLAHARLVRRRYADHERRCARIAAALESGPATAFAIAHRLWPARTVREQPLLVVWEVLGHLDLLLGAGAVRESVTADGSRHGIAQFELVHRRPPQRPVRARDLCSLEPTREPEAHGGGRRARAS
jgi:glyoxylase-like metal-dependent hydrolase (beta-lactamase superfamily II)